MIETISALIDALGGNAVVGEMLGVKHNTVSGWRVRGLPPWATVRLQQMAAATGLRTVPSLFEIRRREALANPQRAA
jgi:hypothetical protein